MSKRRCVITVSAGNCSVICWSGSKGKSSSGPGRPPVGPSVFTKSTDFNWWVRRRKTGCWRLIGKSPRGKLRPPWYWFLTGLVRYRPKVKRLKQNLLNRKNGGVPLDRACEVLTLPVCIGYQYRLPAAVVIQCNQPERIRRFHPR